MHLANKFSVLIVAGSRHYYWFLHFKYFLFFLYFYFWGLSLLPNIRNASTREQFKRSLKSWLFECVYGRRRVWDTFVWRQTRLTNLLSTTTTTFLGVEVAAWVSAHFEFTLPWPHLDSSVSASASKIDVLSLVACAVQSCVGGLVVIMQTQRRPLHVTTHCLYSTLTFNLQMTLLHVYRVWTSTETLRSTLMKVSPLCCKQYVHFL